MICNVNRRLCNRKRAKGNRKKNIEQMKHFLFFFLGLFLNVCLCNFDIHFLTASIFGEGDIKDIRDANFLLKTRLIFGGDELIKAKCTWVVFLPPFLVKSPISVRGDVEEGIVMGSIEQARHIALESNCTPIFSYERSFRTVDEMAWKAFQVVHKQFSFESVATHYFFMLPQAVILSNPLAVFQSISFYRGEEAKNVYLMHLPRGDSFVGCSLNLIVLPVGTVSYGIGSEINSLCSLMAHLEIERGDLHYRRVDVPLYYRFPLELDSANGVTDSQKLEFRREEQLHGEENRKVPAVLLTVAGHNIDWYLFNSSFAKPGVAQNLYRLKDINLDCELKLSIPIVQTASSLPSGALWFSEEKETTSETLVNYTRLRDILFPTEALCSIIFGTLLPDRHKERRIKGEYQKVEEFGDQTLFSFSAVADWVISPEDFNDISPHYNNGGYKWDGKPLSYEEEKLYSQFLKDTEPNLIYHKKNSFNSSLCSIQIIAYGDRHLCDAYQNALRHHKNSAYSGNSLRSGFDDEICFGKPLVYLYTFDGAKHLTREAYYRSGSFLQMCGDISLDEFLAVFDGIFDLCNSTKCQSYFPSNDEIFASLDSVSQVNPLQNVYRSFD